MDAAARREMCYRLASLHHALTCARALSCSQALCLWESTGIHYFYCLLCFPQDAVTDTAGGMSVGSRAVAASAGLPVAAAGVAAVPASHVLPVVPLSMPAPPAAHKAPAKSVTRRASDAGASISGGDVGGGGGDGGGGGGKQSPHGAEMAERQLDGRPLSHQSPSATSHPHTKPIASTSKARTNHAKPAATTNTVIGARRADTAAKPGGAPSSAVNSGRRRRADDTAAASDQQAVVGKPARDEQSRAEVQVSRVCGVNASRTRLHVLSRLFVQAPR
jgi:hypothetical protein